MYCLFQGFQYAFAKRPQHEVDTLGEHFDYNSIMLYDEHAFSYVSIEFILSLNEPKHCYEQCVDVLLKPYSDNLSYLEL